MEFSSLEDFENATGLRLATSEGTLREELPPITTFFNRVLALPIALQNRFFELFEELACDAASRPRSRPALTTSALRR